MDKFKRTRVQETLHVVVVQLGAAGTGLDVGSG